MNKRERVEAALKGKNVDRVPVSAWGHFYEKEGKLDTFVRSMLEFQEYYDWDFMKIQCRYTYHLEDWGFQYTQSGKPGDQPVTTKAPIQKPEDWKKLKVLRPTEGVLGEILEAVKAIKKGLKGEVPFIMTVFSPLMTANYLWGSTHNTAGWNEAYTTDKESLSAGLKTIAETFRLYVQELAKTGIDGLFFATKEANDNYLSCEEFQSFSRPFDEIVLDAAKDMPFTMLHLCIDKIHMKAMSDYPVTSFNWDTDLPGNPGLKEARQLIGKARAICGGSNRVTLEKGSAADVKSELKKSLIEMQDDDRFILTPGCSIFTHTTPEENLRILRNAPEQYQDY